MTDYLIINFYTKTFIKDFLNETNKKLKKILLLLYLKIKTKNWRIKVKEDYKFSTLKVSQFVVCL